MQGIEWRAGSTKRAGYILLTPAVLCIGFLVIYPFVGAAIRVLRESGGIAQVGSVLTNPGYLQTLVVTTRASIISAVICVIVSGYIAWTMRAPKYSWQTPVLMASVLAPLWMGVVTKNYALGALLGRQGPINNLLIGVGVYDTPRTLLYNEPVVVLGMVYSLIPFAVLPLYVGFRQIDIEIIAAAQNLGAKPRQIVTSILLPLSYRVFLASFALLFVLAVGYFVTPSVLGGRKVNFASIVMDDDIFKFFNLANALILGLLLLVVSIVVLVAVTLIAGIRALETGLGRRP